MNEHVELDKIASDISKQVARKINSINTELIIDDMPYKRQYILEKTIQYLDELV